MLDNHTGATAPAESKKIYQTYSGISYDRATKKDRSFKRKNGGGSRGDQKKKKGKGGKAGKKFCINHGHCAHSTAECKQNAPKGGEKGGETTAPKK